MEQSASVNSYTQSPPALSINFVGFSLQARSPVHISSNPINPRTTPIRGTTNIHYHSYCFLKFRKLSFLDLRWGSGVAWDASVISKCPRSAVTLNLRESDASWGRSSLPFASFAPPHWLQLHVLHMYYTQMDVLLAAPAYLYRGCVPHTWGPRYFWHTWLACPTESSVISNTLHNYKR